MKRCSRTNISSSKLFSYNTLFLVSSRGALPDDPLATDDPLAAPEDVFLFFVTLILSSHSDSVPLEDASMLINGSEIEKNLIIWGGNLN